MRTCEAQAAGLAHSKWSSDETYLKMINHAFWNIMKHLFQFGSSKIITIPFTCHFISLNINFLIYKNVVQLAYSKSLWF